MVAGIMLVMGSMISSFFTPQNESMYGGSYYLLATQDIDDGELATNSKVLGLAKQKYQRIQTILASHSYVVDSNLISLSESPVVVENGKEMVQTNSGIGKWAVDLYHASNDQVADSSRPLGTALRSSRVSQAAVRGGAMSVYIDGKDPIINGAKQSSMFTSQPPLLLDESVVKPYITTPLSAVPAGEVPILLPMSEIQSIGLSAQATRTKGFEDTIDETKRAVAQVSGKTVEACFRSDYEMMLVQLALANGNSSVGTMKDDCTSLSGAEHRVLKQVADELGSNTSVSVQKVRFKVVGILPDSIWYASQAPSQAVSILSMLRVGVINTAVIPLGSSGMGVLDNRIFATSNTVMTGGTRHAMTLERFDSQAALLDTHQKLSCPADSLRCARGTYRFSEVGTNIINTVDTLPRLATVATGLATIVALISLVVTSITYVNLVTDEGREIVLLRTLGMKRLHMSSIYAVYLGTLFLMSSVAAYVLSYVLIGAVNHLLTHKLQAVYYFVYGVTASTPGYEFGQIFRSTWLLLATGFLGIAVLVELIAVSKTSKYFGGDNSRAS